MRILYLCDEYPPGPHGGIGTAVQLMAREMVASGYHVEVAGLYSPGYGQADSEVDQGVRVHRFRETIDHPLFQQRDRIAVRVLHRILKGTGIRHWSLKYSLKNYHARLHQLVRDQRIDLVVVPDYQDYMRFCLSPLPLPRFAVPQVTVLHGSKTFLARMADQKESPTVLRMETDWVGQAQGIIAVSRFVEKHSRHYFNWSPSIPTRVIPNGLNLDGSPDDEERERDPNQVIFAGTLVESKGIYSLVKAWNQVASMRPRARLDIYGKGPVPKIRKLIRPQYRSSVRFLGHVSRGELSRVYARASVGVFPSFLETFGIAALEAMYARLAVIYTKRTAGPELIDDKVDGILVDPANTEELAEKILYMLDHPGEARAMGQRARQKVVERYEMSRVAADHREFYKSILSRP